MGLLNFGPSVSSFFCEREDRSKRSNGEGKMQLKGTSFDFQKEQALSLGVLADPTNLAKRDASALVDISLKLKARMNGGGLDAQITNGSH